MLEEHYARLISITPDAEKLMAYCARVSSPNQTNENIAGLLHYCLKHGHISVFTMANLVLELNTTRAIAQQFIRHTGFAVQEFCIAGSNRIKLENSTSLPIQALHKKMLKGEKFRARVWDGSKFIFADIAESFSLGKKQCFAYENEKGAKLVCTAEHKVLTENGWLEIDEAFIKRIPIAFNGLHSAPNAKTVKFMPIVVKLDAGMLETYDLHIDHAEHSYIASTFVVHNSQRYAVVSYDLPISDVRLQDAANRQASNDLLSPEQKAGWQARQAKLNELSYALYTEMLEAGIAKECARNVLPLNTPTRLYANGTIRQWLTYFKSRLHKSAQLEHKLIAESAWGIFKAELPIIAEAAQSFVFGKDL